MFLQALRYLQNVCNHPKLVLTTQHPEFEHVKQELKTQNTNLADIQHAAKLPALKQLLLDCGIGVESAGMGQSSDLVINQHRALIFCQLKAMLDIVENDLLKYALVFYIFLVPCSFLILHVPHHLVLICMCKLYLKKFIFIL